MLDCYADAATSAEHEAMPAGQHLDKAAMKAEIERRYAELGSEAAGLPAVPPPASPTFTQYGVV